MSTPTSGASRQSRVRPGRYGWNDGDEVQASGPETADPEAARFERRVRRRARAVLRGGLGGHLYRHMQGAFPTEVLKLTGSPGLDPSLLSPAPSSLITRGHVLDSEWYFTDDSVRRIVAAIGEAATQRGPLRILLLGCPRLVEPLVATGAQVTLVDHSKHGVDQFVAPRTLASATWLRASIGPALLRPGALGVKAFDAVVMDPPWYPDDYVDWLSVAASVVRVGGAVHCVLLPRLTRPSAQLERQTIRKMLRGAGETATTAVGLTYLIPEFEDATFVANRISVPYPWRTADLVSTVLRGRVESTYFFNGRSLLPTASGLGASKAPWFEVALDRHYVKLRASGTRVRSIEDLVVRAVLPNGSLQLVSVSRRAAAPDETNIWTSRNRVAVTNDALLLKHVLDDIVHPHLASAPLIERLHPASFQVLSELLFG